jgi:hypothetical protein
VELLLLMMLLLAPKRVVQAWRAGAWAGVGSGRREILMFSFSSRGLEVAGDAGGDAAAIDDDAGNCSGMGDSVDIFLFLEGCSMLFFFLLSSKIWIMMSLPTCLHEFAEYYITVNSPKSTFKDVGTARRGEWIDLIIRMCQNCLVLAPKRAWPGC